MAEVSRGRTTWFVPLLVFLAVVLVAALTFNLVNLDTGGETLPELPAGGSPPDPEGIGPRDPVANAILFAILGMLVVATIYAVIRARGRQTRVGREPSWWDILSSVAGMLFLIAILLVWPRVLQIFTVGTDGATPGPGDGSGSGSPWPTAAGLPAGLFLLGSLFVAFAVVAFLMRRGAGPREAILDLPFTGLGMRREAAWAVQQAIEDIELGGDVRAAVLACFQRFCALLAGRGLANQATLTPREIERLATERLGVGAPDAEVLTSLFEVARYSDHALDEGDRRRAIESLARIRAALEA